MKKSKNKRVKSEKQIKKSVKNKASEPYSKLLMLCFYAVFFGLCCLLIYRMVYTNTTIKLHIDYTKSLVEGTKVLPHLGYFYFLWGFKVITGLSFEMATTILLSLFATLNAAAVNFVFKKLLPNYSTAELLAMTGLTMIVAAIYLPFFNKAVYFGQGSPNMWHNSTVIAVKALSVLGFFMMINFLEEPRYQRSWLYAGVISVLLTLSVFIKPTFVIVSLPAVGLYILFRHLKDFSLYWKTAAIVLPAIVLMLYQYTSFETGFGVDGGGRTNKIEFLTVWRLFTPNVGVSILITIAFPLAILGFRFREVVRNQYLLVAWIALLVGMLQFALLAEYNANGTLITSANWIGGYLIGLTLVFVFTMVEYVKWLKEANSDNGIEKIKIWTTSILLALHAYSGAYYIYELIAERKTLLIFY